MIHRRRRRARHDEIVLTGLDPTPDADSVRNMAGYDHCPPAVRQRIAYHPRPMIFVKTPEGQTILAEIRHVDWSDWAQRQS